jgi:hypothetical protein
VMSGPPVAGWSCGGAGGDCSGSGLRLGGVVMALVAVAVSSGNPAASVGGGSVSRRVVGDAARLAREGGSGLPLIVREAWSGR